MKRSKKTKKPKSGFKTFLKDLVRLIMVLIAAFIMAMNVQTFVNDGGLYPGGVMGLTIIIQRIASSFLNIELPFTPINLVLNAVPVFIGFKFIGKKFTVFSMIMVIAYGIFVDILPDFTLTEDALLIAVFGGVINAVAIALCLKFDATSGGTDFISIFLSQKKGIDAFPIILAANTVILIAAGALFGWDKALYSMIFQFVSTITLHTLYRTYQQRTLFVITDKPQDISALIYDISGHGATFLEGESSYEHEDKKVVYSVVSAADTRKLIPAIRQADPGAFINCIRTEEIMGNFYYKPRD